MKVFIISLFGLLFNQKKVNYFVNVTDGVNISWGKKEIDEVET